MVTADAFTATLFFGFLRGGAGLAHSVKNRPSAIHPKVVIRLNMGQKLLADGTLQMDQRPTGYAFEVEMVAAISPPYVLVDVSRLGIASVFPHSSLVAKLREMPV